MQLAKICALSVLIFTVPALPALALTADQSNDSGRLLPHNLNYPAQQGECSERVGPFATQTTAWQRLHQAEGQGYAVSGVFPCYDGYGSRGYCFNVFYRC